jgi:hypothetical protein
MRFLYKYPQRRFPYEELVAENEARDREVPEYELLDTNAFDEDRYWDVFVEVGLFNCRLIMMLNKKKLIHHYSMQRMQMIPKIFTFVSLRTIEDLIQLRCTLSRSSGSPIPGHGLWKNLRCRVFLVLFVETTTRDV